MQQLTRSQLMILLFITDKFNGAQFDHIPSLLRHKSAVDALEKAKYVTCNYEEMSLNAKFNLIVTATKKGQEYVNNILLPPEKIKV